MIGEIDAHRPGFHSGVTHVGDGHVGRELVRLQPRRVVQVRVYLLRERGDVD